jgi:branched-chain amino acid aminotransferase
VLPWNRNESSPLVGIKSTSYAENVLGHRWAQERGYSEGLYLNNEGFLVEGSTTNVFLVMDGAVVTPAESHGLLPGIIREVLLENGWAQEASLTLVDLEQAEEIFLTSSTRGIHPVQKCGAREFDSVGIKTRSLMEAFQGLPK